MKAREPRIAGNCMTHGENLPCYECSVNAEIARIASTKCPGPCAVCHPCQKSTDGEHCMATSGGNSECVTCGWPG